MVTYLLWATTVLLAFLIGMEWGRWNRKIIAYFTAIRYDLQKKEEVVRKVETMRPGVVRTPPPGSAVEVDLDDETGGVMPMSPAQVAAENERVLKGRKA